MALPLAEQKYSSIRLADADLENDSDTTLGSTGFLEKGTKRRRRFSKNPATQSLFTWVRWSIVILLQSVILFLLVRSSQPTNRKTPGWSQADTETGGDINGLYVPSKMRSLGDTILAKADFAKIASHKYTLLVAEEETFVPDFTSNDNRMEIRKNWDKLMPRSCSFSSFCATFS